MTSIVNTRPFLNRLQWEHLILTILVVIGAALRFAELWAPLTHDELSAICRLNYDTFSDLLMEGIYPDGHPAGMQVMLWLWSRVVGTSAPLLRLPFLLMGIVCIPLMYSIARRWFGIRSAMLSATLIAFSQYTIYYSMPIRPYGVGLFFILLALHFWTRLCIEHRDQLVHLIGYALASAVCAYIHYFCALTAALLAVAGLFLIGRKSWHYLASCFVAVLLFLPHLPITLHHLFDLGGVGGWLGCPEADFFWRYLRYLTHHSYSVLIVVVVAVLLCSNYHLWRQRRPLLVAATLLFLLPLVTGYLYSRLVNPVLQFSVLIFSYPFLLLALTALCDDERRSLMGNILTVLLGVVLLVTLFSTRQHYDVIQREYIDHTACIVNDADRCYGSHNVLNLAIIPQPYWDYYACRPTDVSADTLTDAVLLDQYLDSATADYVVTTKLLEPAMAAVQRHYPILLRYYECTTSEVCLFAKHGDGIKWTQNTVASGSVVSQGEYTMLMDTVVADFSDSRFFLINTSAFADRGGLQLVMETWVNGRMVDWRNVSLNNTAVLPLKEELCIKSRADLRHSRIKIYLWNPDGIVDGINVDYQVSIIPDNPYVYALLEEL